MASSRCRTPTYAATNGRWMPSTAHPPHSPCWRRISTISQVILEGLLLGFSDPSSHVSDSAGVICLVRKAEEIKGTGVMYRCMNLRPCYHQRPQVGGTGVSGVTLTTGYECGGRMLSASGGVCGCFSYIALLMERLAVSALARFLRSPSRRLCKCLLSLLPM